MDGTGSGVTNRIRIGSHTASDVRKIASRMHCTHTLCEPGYVRQRHLHVEIAREVPVTERGFSQSRCHASHLMTPATEPTSDD